MKQIGIICFLLFALGQMTVHAQRINDQDRLEREGYQIDPAMKVGKDSSNVEVITPAPKLYMWNVDQRLGSVQPIEVDTVYHHFQNTNLVEGVTGHYNYLGNLGAPRHNRIFFERAEMAEDLFSQPYDFFIIQPDQFKFTNSNIPYTNLSYFKAGDKVYGEERFKSYFSVNVNKRLAFGFNFDYLYGRGFYASQSTAFFNGAGFASYIGNRYQLHAIYSNNSLKMRENGGITDDRYITNPEDMSEGKKEYESMNIPVNMQNTWNRNHNLYFFLSHRYNLGFMKKYRKSEKDTVDTKEYIPVTSFIHTFKIERNRRRFLAKTEPENFYTNSYIDAAASNDTTTYVGIKNTFGISLLEGFNKYAKAGLAAFISHQHRQYELMGKPVTENDKTTPGAMERFTEQEVFVGGELSKKQGNFIHYDVSGEVGILDKALGQFRLKGEGDMNFRLTKKDTVTLRGRVSISNTLPVFYMRHYHSNHFWWDNDSMEKEFKSRIEGQLDIPRWGTSLKAGVENVKNYTYFDSNGLPAQLSDNIQVVSATLTQNFRLGILHLDNEVTYQKSGNETVLPLPQLSLYHNLYLQTKLAKKVLSLQLGVDVRYFSGYYAPAYTPALGQYTLQADDDKRVKIGDYPIVNVYANLHLKRTRFFVMAYHVNQSTGKYFLTPHYPINQMMFKFGLSWNFYD